LAAFFAGAAAFLAGAAAFFAGAAAFFAGAAFAAALAGALAAGFFAGAFMAFILLEHRLGAGVSEVRQTNNESDIASDLTVLFLGFLTFGKQIFPVTPIDKTDR
jgi:hypothetical protein